MRGSDNGFFRMNYDTSIDTQSGDATYVVHDGPGGEPVLERRIHPRYWLIALVALAIVVAIWFVARGHKTDDAAGAEQTPVVTVVEPGRTTVAGEIDATGSLAARRELPVGSVGEGGRVTAVLVDAGDWVKKGQALAVIDRSVQSQQIASQVGQVQVAEANARLAQDNLDRALKLVDRGFISKADVDRLTATRDSAVAQVKVARGTLGQLQASAARLNILAPQSGFVLQRNVEVGQVVSGGSGALFTMAENGSLELRAKVAEDDLARLSVGQSATVTPAGADTSYQGQIWQLSPVIDQTSRQGEARIALPFSKDLRPGGFASAAITSGTVVAPVLPDSAIQNDAQGSFVYIVGADDKVHRRPVKTGIVTERGIVISQGLSGSEKVVLRAGGFLSEGDVVQPKLITEQSAGTGG